MPKKSNLVATVCAWCGVEFIDHGSNHRKYCSHACYSKGRKKQPDTACKTCGKMFASYGARPNPYCSRACSHRGQERKDERACLQCGEPFTVYPSRPDKFCSPACYHEHQKKPPTTYGEFTCEMCGKAFTKTNRKYSTRFCSKSCSSRHNGLNTRGVQITKHCERCGKPFVVVPSRAHVRHCSMKCEADRRRETWGGPTHPRWSRVEMTCEVCGKVCMVKRCHVDRFRACSRRCASTISKINQPTVSSIERIMADRFAAAGLSFKQQFQIAYYVVDFAFPDARLVVEVDGDYWHSLPKVQRVDKSKNTYLSRHGWRLVRLAESDIKRDPDACVKRVKAALRVPDEQMMLMHL